MRPGIGAGRLSPEAAARLTRSRASGAEPLRPPDPTDRGAIRAWRQEIHDAWLAGDPSAAECDHDEVTIAGVRCLTAGPDRFTAGAAPASSAQGAPSAQRPPGPIVVYLHGGGYALGSPEVALPITERLARSVAVVSVDYRLAPEHPFPAGRDDARAVIDAVASSQPGRTIVVAGDSAGANLAVSAALAGPVPAAVGGLVLLSPHLDHRPDRSPDDDRGTVDPTSDVDHRAAAWLRAAYCGPIDPADPRVSPLRADLSDLPPTLVQAGTLDGARHDAVRFARLARTADVPVTLDLWDGLWHTWHYHRDLPEAAQALSEAATFARRRGIGTRSGDRGP